MNTSIFVSTHAPQATRSGVGDRFTVAPVASGRDASLAGLVELLLVVLLILVLAPTGAT